MQFWALLGFIHGILVAFRLPNQSLIAFLLVGLIYCLLWTLVSWIVMKLMKSKYRKGFGIFLLVSGSLIVIGSVSSNELFMFGFGILQLIVAIPLLLPLILKIVRKSSSDS